MKRIVIITATMACAASFTACKRTYTCDCYSPAVNRHIRMDVKDTRKGAKDYCKAQSTSTRFATTDFTCTLD